MSTQTARGWIVGALIACVSVASLPSVSASAPTAPDAPWGLVAVPLVRSANESTMVLLRWEPPADDGGSPITEYRVYRSVVGVAGGSSLIGVAANPMFTDLVDSTALVEAYEYSVTAVNSVGEGTNSSGAVTARVAPWCAAVESAAETTLVTECHIMVAPWFDGLVTMEFGTLLEAVSDALGAPPGCLGIFPDVPPVVSIDWNCAIDLLPSL